MSSEDRFSSIMTTMCLICGRMAIAKSLYAECAPLDRARKHLAGIRDMLSYIKLCQLPKYAIRRLFIALICQTVGSVPFKSLVLSFYAILSRKVRGKGRVVSEGPGNLIAICLL